MYTKDSISNELNKVQVTPIMEAILDLHHHLLIGLLVILGLVTTYILLYIYNKRIWIINSIISLFMVLGIMFNDVGVHAVGPSLDGRISPGLNAVYNEAISEDVARINAFCSLEALHNYMLQILAHAIQKSNNETAQYLISLNRNVSTVDEAKEIIFDIFIRSKETYVNFSSYLDRFYGPAAIPTKVAEKVVDVVASSSSAVPDVVSEDDSYPKYIKYGLIVSSIVFGGYMIYKGMEISGLLDNLFGSEIPDGEIIKDSVEKATTKEKVVGAGMIVLGLTFIVAGVIVIFGGK